MKEAKRSLKETLAISALFSLTIAVLTFSSSFSVSVCRELSRETETCHFGVSLAGATASAAVVAFRWHTHSVSFEKAYVTLAATMTGSFAFYVHTTSQMYSEFTEAIRHLYQLVTVPLGVAECLKNETTYSLNLIKSAIAESPVASSIKNGVIDIVTGVRQVDQSQNELKRAMGVGFSWLQSRGLSCEHVITEPFSQCNAAVESAKAECFKTGLGALCSVADVGTEVCRQLMKLKDSACLHLSPDTISEMLASFRAQMEKLVAGAIRLRVGVRVQVKTTGSVEEKLSETLKPVRDSLNKALDFLTRTIKVILFLAKYLGFSSMLLWPIGYLICFLWGPLSFDNRRFPEKGMRKFKATVRETLEIIRLFAMMNFDFVIVAGVLVLNHYLTLFVKQLTESLSKFGEAAFLKLEHGETAEGIEWIERLFSQQLQTLNNAIGLSRLVKCVKPPLPIRYSYSMYYLTIAQRLVTVVMRVKYPHVAAMICGKFFGRRHRIRMRYLRARASYQVQGKESRDSSETGYRRVSEITVPDCYGTSWSRLLNRLRECLS